MPSGSAGGPDDLKWELKDEKGEKQCSLGGDKA